MPDADSLTARTASHPRPPAHLPAHIVHRPRLVALLDQPGARLVIVTGPAGSGKTVAVRDWLVATRAPAAWLSLEGRHTDPEHLLEDLLAVLEDLAPGVDEAVAREDPADQGVAQIIARVVEHIAGAPPTTLVLDDLHVIDRSLTPALLAQLLDVIPATNLRLVICSRADPPLPLHRFRLAGELAEVREADLRFDRDEVAQFFARFPDVELAPADIDRLAERTEGWAAGLQFAALSLAGREDAAALVDRLTGSDRHVADFLLDEVLDRQPGEIRDFLLVTSVLERMSAELCEHVTGRSGAALLRRIEADNLFLVPLDDDREWFRYHHLFGQLLRRELRVSRPDVERDAHERAAAWFADHGEPGLAIDHLLAAGHDDDAFVLITRHLRDYLSAGRHETVRGWLARLSPAFVDATPGHQLMVTLAYARAGQLAQGRVVIERARATASPERLAAVGIHYDVTQAAFAALLGDPETAIAVGNTVWDHRGDVDVAAMPPDLGTAVRELWGYLPAALARAHALLDDRAGVRRWAAVLRRQGPRLPGDIVGALGAEAWAEARNGRLRAGAELAEQALALALAQGRGSRRASIGARAALALVHRERDELDRAVEVLAPHIDSARREGHIAITTLGEIELSRVELTQGRADDAVARLLRVRAERAVDGTPRFLAEVIDRAECRIRVQMGDHDRAQDLLDDIQPGPEHTLLALRLALNAGCQITAVRLLAELPEPDGNRAREFEVAALRARAAASDGDLVGARRELAEVAEAAQREGAVRVFLDEGFDILDLVASPPAGRTRVTAHNALVEALSERELSVLRYLPSRLSNREIGDELFVSLNTVKSHLKTIYRKLDVERRDDAVRRARQLGLL